MVVFSSILVALYSVLFVQESPSVYYAYAFFPVMFWEEVWARRSALIKGSRVLFAHVTTEREILKLILSTAGFFGLLQALVRLRCRP